MEHSTYTGDRIRQIRKEKGLTQNELGELCGINAANIRKYESGRQNPKLETVRKIAAALDTPIGDFVMNWSTISQEEISNDLQNGLPLNELAILQNYRVLNEKGQEKAKEQMEMLTKIPEYRKE